MYYKKTNECVCVGWSNDPGAEGAHAVYDRVDTRHSPLHEDRRAADQVRVRSPAERAA